MINKVPLKWRTRYGKVMKGKHFPGEAAATPPEVRTTAVYEFGEPLSGFRIKKPPAHPSLTIFALSLVQSE